ncbi:DNA-directed RNA polymerase subunit alpha [Dethiosulfovibrio salsuginis]|uniref:DNA-directed RNA polymerase subunit alpha n=1 Tax=Dethiosulfovibrio salsuginis TaxID=561720 RepID=A0A1X7IVR0_9BACT|nr:DNA-directed RNA polymerase subunit alpha [Dethiosulfovibrio salsuginis]SMG18909.1 DNA-directed RNA polymerase subunit alpha [Dethiosulfovibrio salsuginis]
MRPEIRVEECSATSARVVIGPLERGFGVTLGNALRRVLLSSIKGAAITSVRIDGVVHEFSTIPGVEEDVIELLLNLKHIPIRSHCPEVRVLRLDVEGERKVTAADFQPDSDIEFVDPEAYICTLAEGTRLSLEVYIEQGVGYASNDRPRPNYLPVDALLIDAIFTPIQRVKYEVQAERVGQKTDYEKIVMNVVTDGVVAPDVAVAEAAKLLRKYFTIVVEDIQKLHPSEQPVVDEADVPQVESKEDGVDDASEKEENTLFSRGVRDLELSIRSENCLLRGGIHTIGDLVSRAKDDLLKIRNLGKISLKEIEEKLENLGLSLQNDRAGDTTDKEDESE